MGKTPLFKLNLPFPWNNEIHWNDNSDLGNSNFMLWFAYSTPNTSQWYEKHKWTNIQQGPKTRYREMDLKQSKRRAKAMSCSGPIIDDGGCISALEWK